MNLYDKLRLVDIGLVPCTRKPFVVPVSKLDLVIIDGKECLPICFVLNSKQLNAGYLCTYANNLLVPNERLIIDHVNHTVQITEWYPGIAPLEAWQTLTDICSSVNKEGDYLEQEMDIADELADELLVGSPAKATYLCADIETAYSVLLSALYKRDSGPYARIPKELREYIQADLDRLNHPDTPPDENKYIIHYLNTLSSIPWNKYSNPEFNINSLTEQLDMSHYGLEQLKTDLISLFNLYKTSGVLPRTICLAGPPNSGKTSLLRSIAKAARHKSIVIPMGGMRDSNTLLGFNRTYRDSKPGAIVKALVTTQCMNPIIILDEIDKTTEEIQNQLLHILDPDHRDIFVDNYLGIPLDLSKCLFLATANDLAKISGPLSRRLLFFVLPEYKLEERRAMIRDYIFPNMIKKHNISNMTLDDLVINELAKDKTPGRTEDTLLRLISRAYSNGVSNINYSMYTSLINSRTGTRLGF